MSGLDKNRKRNHMVSFRVSPEEQRELEARIKLTGMPKGKYIIESVLNKQINITVGKYQSDRLSIEIQRLYKQLQCIDSNSEELIALLEECKVLMEQFINITK
ncbi:hypothetical protein B5E58_11765 [Tyzzerella sp. An114]|uniref:plasmid mobilization protein n=1 Tax=Tyzzerella sp. An114 TaxID=1965545 RepID=UPI000B431264|nr:hypothetical protein [Tyzzerella sp. An114]OUQ55787.1 hypothetical protein B5E58_11765 [Tyzzerella sp. An114]